MIDIRHRETKAVLYSADVATLREAIEQAARENASLSDADLKGADLGGADLHFVRLAFADLKGANLRNADLSAADLEGADLRDADLTGATLFDADFGRADLRDAKGLPSAPVIPDLDKQILSLVERGEGNLRMADWHTCETTHCRAGWAVHLAGAKGKRLEQGYGSSVAGALIYHASAGYVPDFYTTNEDALADMRARAARSDER